MLVLVKNEVNKILSKRKMLLITVIMLILVSLFAYGQNYQYKNTLNKYLKTTTESGDVPWQSLQKQQIQDLKNRLNRPDTPEASKVSTYSLGMRQRLGLAQSLIHKPKLLILDEPTNGLDPAGINEFRHIIKDLAKKENIAVLFSSHLISEVELMCDKVAIIKNGALIKYSSVSELINNQEVFFVLSDNQRGIEILKNNWNINGSLRDGRIEAKVDISKLEEINSSFIQEGLKIKFVNANQKTLEDLFLTLTVGDTAIN